MSPPSRVLALSRPPAFPSLHGHACPLHRGQWRHPHSGVPSAGTGEAVLQEAAAGREAVQPSGGGTEAFGTCLKRF